MKTYIIAFFALLIAFPAQAWATDPANEIDAESQIEGVTVFLKGAQVERTTDVILKSGSNKVYFRGLAKNIDPKSIQVKAPNEILINSVTIETNYLNLNEHKPRVKMLNDSLTILADLVDESQSQRSNLNEEKKMIMANQKIASAKEGLNIDELKATTEFFRTRLFDLSKRMRKIDLKLRGFSKRQKQIRAQLKELRFVRNQPSNDIAIVFNTYGTRKVPITLSYVVQDARWTPRYNLRAKNSSSPINLEYQADVFQNTGVDWSQVELTLSTGNPQLGGSQPEIRPWKLYVQVPPPAPKKRKAKAGAYAAPPVETMNEESYDDDGDDWGEAEEVEAEPEYVEFGDYDEVATLADYTVVNEGATTAEFQISIKQDVPSGNKPQQVTVQNSELTSDFRHFTVPKLDKDAFLISEVTGWEGLNLLPGYVQIFFEGTYVSESYIDPAYTDDTLRFSLGRDKRVVIEREQLKDYNEKKIFGSQIERTFAYEIKVRNTKDEPVNLRLEDQIPISQDKAITVKIEEISGANLDAESGLLYWDMEVAGSETKTVKLIYSVKYPKNRVVPGL